MATIAADAGVGIGTLYRHSRTREDLLDYLAHRSFEQVLLNVQTAERDGTAASDALRRFIEAAIAQRNELVLPLHGGLPVTALDTIAVRDQVHRAVQRILERGRADGTISQDVTPRDVVVFGAMLAQPRQSDPNGMRHAVGCWPPTSMACGYLGRRERYARSDSLVGGACRARSALSAPPPAPCRPR